jgi:hypothetical protein
MMFLRAMEPLHRMFLNAQERGLLGVVSKGCQAFRVSLYADDDAVFIKPTPEDLCVTNNILKIFAEASGLVTNMKKIHFYPIHYQHTDMNFLSQNNLAVSSFPCIYLGLPLHFKKLPKSILQGSFKKLVLEFQVGKEISLHIQEEKLW